MANVPWPILFCSVYNTWCLCHTPSIFLPRLSLKPAEAEFTRLLMRKFLLCIRFQFSPRWSSPMADRIPPLVHVQRSWKQQKLCSIGLSQEWELETEQKNLFFLQGCWRPIWNRELTFVCVTIWPVCSILPMCAWCCSSHNQRLGKTWWPMGLIFAQPRPQQHVVLQPVWGKVILTDKI